MLVASTKTFTCSLLVLMMVTRLSRAEPFEQSHMDASKETGVRGGGSEGISNTLLRMQQRDAHVYSLWEQYNSSSSFERSIVDVVTQIAYVDSRISMLGLILFGARNYKSTLRSIRRENLPFVDDQRCLKSTMELFEKNCGIVKDHRMMQALANICNYVAKKEAIKDAILVACAMHTIDSHVIDVGIPEIDFIPAPIHGTSQYCGRVSVNGISRIKLQSYAKAYQLMLVPSQSIPEIYDNLIQVCFHRNDSLGLCDCGKDDWRSVQRRSWSSTMSPYEQKLIDVKFIVQLPGSVTITLDEVSQGWRYVFLAGGIALLFMAVSNDIFDKYVDAGMVRYVKWAMRVLAVTCIFMSSVDTPLAMVAVCFCLAVCYVMSSILAPIDWKTILFPVSGFGQGTVNAGDGGGSMGSQSYFYYLLSIIRYRNSSETRESVAALASSPEFEEWVIRNTHRIKLRRKNN